VAVPQATPQARRAQNGMPVGLLTEAARAKYALILWALAFILSGLGHLLALPPNDSRGVDVRCDFRSGGVAAEQLVGLFSVVALSD
jgi:hypothetical protein